MRSPHCAHSDDMSKINLSNKKMFVKNIESRRFRFRSLSLSPSFYERVARSIELDRMERLRMRKKEKNQKYKMKRIKSYFIRNIQ